MTKPRHVRVRRAHRVRSSHASGLLTVASGVCAIICASVALSSARAAKQLPQSSLSVRTDNELACNVAATGTSVVATCTHQEPLTCDRALEADLSPAPGREVVWSCSVAEAGDILAVTSGGRLTWAGQVGQNIGDGMSVRAVDVVRDAHSELLVRVNGRDGGECEEGGDTLSTWHVLMKWGRTGMEWVLAIQELECPGMGASCHYEISLGPMPADRPAAVVTVRGRGTDCGDRGSYSWNAQAFRFERARGRR